MSTGSGSGSFQCVHFRENLVHDNWGECIDAQGVDTGSVVGNEVFNCWSVNIYLDGSTDILVDRNFVYANDPIDRYSKSGHTRRANGILLARENGSIAAPNRRTRITNNIVDSVGIAIGYSPFGDGDDAHDTFENLWIAQNTIRWTDPVSRNNETTYGGIVIGRPDVAASGFNHVRNNIVQEPDVQWALDWPATAAENCPSGCNWFIRNNLFTVKPDGVDASNLQDDPWLMGPVLPLDATDEGGYRLAPGSPAISAGMSVLTGSGPNDGSSKVDYFATARCLSTPSIGIHEAPSSCVCGLTNCSGACKNLLTDRYNCGRCGNQCTSPTPNCSWGKCQTCAPGYQDCCGDGHCRSSCDFQCN